MAASAGGELEAGADFDAVQAVVAETGVLKGRNRRVLDSTIVDDAVATQNTVTQLVAVIRKVRREVPGAAEVVARVGSAHDWDHPGKPRIAWDDGEARTVLIDALVKDAFALLAVVGDRDPAAGRRHHPRRHQRHQGGCQNRRRGPHVAASMAVHTSCVDAKFRPGQSAIEWGTTAKRNFLVTSIHSTATPNA